MFFVIVCLLWVVFDCKAVSYSKRVRLLFFRIFSTSSSDDSRDARVLIGQKLRHIFNNHPARGDYNTELTNFQNGRTRDFLMFLTRKKSNERKCSCSDNHLSNCTKTIILLRLNEYCRIILSTSSRGLFDNIHFAFGELLLNSRAPFPKLVKNDI